MLKERDTDFDAFAFFFSWKNLDLNLSFLEGTVVGQTYSFIPNKANVIEFPLYIERSTWASLY